MYCSVGRGCGEACINSIQMALSASGQVLRFRLVAMAAWRNNRPRTLSFSQSLDQECVAILVHLLGYRREYIEYALSSQSYDHAAASYWILRCAISGCDMGFFSKGRSASVYSGRANTESVADRMAFAITDRGNGIRPASMPSILRARARWRRSHHGQTQSRYAQRCSIPVA